jgi:predicted GH43/DUF377 family glycosyl hydrolase
MAGSQWDNFAPSDEYFTQLVRVTKNQIIWGGNHFNLAPTRGIIIWDKPTMRIPTMADGELAWTSFDAGKISIIGSIQTKEGPLLIYDASVQVKTQTLLQAGAVIFDKNDPKKIIWRSAYPIWQGVVEAKRAVMPIEPMGIVSLGNVFVMYWMAKDGGLIVIKIPALFKDIEENRYNPRILNRYTGNPIIEPRVHYDWEGEGTFNPAAFEDDEGMIHLLYRAVGRDGISRVGYAKSKDGKYFTNRLSFPIFEPLRSYDFEKKKRLGLDEYNPIMYTSGGSWSGAEDPRAVRIGKRVYMIYVAFDISIEHININ